MSTATNVAKQKHCEWCRELYSPTSNRSRFCSTDCKIRGQSTPDANGCWVWSGPSAGHGYGVTPIGKKTTTAHTLSYSHYRGPIPKGIHVCHKCDVKLCVNPDHLFLGTRIDNMRDCAVKGRNARKLTEQQVREIRSATGVSKAELSRRYGVTDAMIGNIIRGKWWKDVGLVE